MSPRQLVVTAPRTLAYRPVEPQELGPTQVRLRTVASAISHGTELHLYRGTAPFASRSFDPDTRVFTDDADTTGYPMPLGYELVGEVVERGPQVDEVAIGDLVHAAVPHADEAVVDLAHPDPLRYPAQPLPDGMPPETGLFTALTCVALFATHDAAIKLGDRVVVSGLGVIGLLVAILVPALSSTRRSADAATSPASPSRACRRARSSRPRSSCRGPRSRPAPGPSPKRSETAVPVAPSRQIWLGGSGGGAACLSE
jgi:threonine dehydrogenase-like Zn-dependent dehydrogenase